MRTFPSLLRLPFVLTDTPFLPCDAMHSAVIAGMRCLSVRPSVCHVRELRQNE